MFLVGKSRFSPHATSSFQLLLCSCLETLASILLYSLLVLWLFLQQFQTTSRYDDVEDFYYNTVQSNLSNWFIDNNVGVTARIVLLQALSRVKTQLL
jgi:hypothetical protein